MLKELMMRGAEALYDLLNAPDRPSEGWYREHTRSGDFMGLSFSCRCGWTSNVLAPAYDGFQKLEVRCPQCNNRSKPPHDLTKLPVRVRSDRGRYIDTWSMDEGDRPTMWTGHSGDGKRLFR